MYEEGKKHLNINWGSLIIKLLIFALVIFLACWIFSKIANGKKTNTKNNTMAETTTTKNAEDNFDENLDRMKAVAFEYFKQTKLPEKVGSTEKLTLEEMLEKKLLLDFTDNGKSCDLKESYIQATRTLDDNYALRVNLTCGKKSDYILANIKKENICTNNTCNNNTANNNNNNNSNNNSSSNNNNNSNNNSSNSSSSNNKNNSNSSNGSKKTTTTTTTTVTITCTGRCCNTCCLTNCNNNTNNNSNNNTKPNENKKERYYEYVKWSDWTEGYSYHSKAENKKVSTTTYNYCKQYETTYYTIGFFAQKYKIKSFEYEYYLNLPSSVNSVKIVNPTYYDNLSDYQAFINNRDDYKMGSNVGNNNIFIDNAKTFKESSLDKNNYTFEVGKAYYDYAQKTWATNITTNYLSYNNAKKYYSKEIDSNVIFAPVKFDVIYTKEDTCKRDLDSNSNLYKGYTKIDEKTTSKWMHRIPEYTWSKENNLNGYTKTENYEDRNI